MHAQRLESHISTMIGLNGVLQGQKNGAEEGE